MQLAIATDTYALILATKEDIKAIPPEKDNCVVIGANTNELRDIEFEVIIKQLWQE
jgi:hypothetical protein